MTWDAEGNRITFKSSTRTNDTDTYTFVYDPTASVPAVIEEISPTGSVVKYIRGPGGNLIARITGSGETETIQYYHFDEQGSVIFLTSSTGEVTDKYTYDDWGNVTHVGTTNQPYQYIGALGYYTHHQDQNLKQMQLGIRFYDPKIGRFTQLDPIGDGLNWYAYCGGDPKNGVDPWGLKTNYFALSAAVFSSALFHAYSPAVYYDIYTGNRAAFSGIKWMRLVPILSGLYEATDDLGYTYQKYTTGEASGWAFAWSYANWTLQLGGTAFLLEGAINGALGGRLSSPTVCQPHECFPAGTVVSTPDGGKPIETIKQNDFVWSFDDQLTDIDDQKPEAEDLVQVLDTKMKVVKTTKFSGLSANTRICFNGRVYDLKTNNVLVNTGIVTNRILETFKRKSDALVDLTVKSADGKKTIITATPEHPFFVPAVNDYVSISKLTPGTILKTTAGDMITVVGSALRRGSFDVYNFHVEGKHNYYVSEQEILVHNASLPPRSVVEEKGVKIEHYYHGDEHGPAHMHVKGKGLEVRIGQNGKPLDGDPELSPFQRNIVKNNIQIIRKTAGKIMRWYKNNSN